MTGDWRIYRPAIWLAMLGIAVLLLLSPPYFGVLLIGAAIGVAVRIERRRRGAAPPPRAREGRRRR
jgi:hypothetical protein